MTTPSILLQASEIIRATLPRESFDERGVWRGRDLMVRCRSDAALLLKTPRKIQAAALKHAQDLLAPLADSPLCRSKKRPWRGDCVTLDTPYGRYIWTFTVGMVLDLRDLPPEFVAGFRHGCKTGEIQRDDNPYPFMSGDRSESWDHGYILGITEKKKLRQWIKARRVESPDA